MCPEKGGLGDLLIAMGEPLPQLCESSSQEHQTMSSKGRRKFSTVYGRTI